MRREKAAKVKFRKCERKRDSRRGLREGGNQEEANERTNERNEMKGKTKLQMPVERGRKKEKGARSQAKA